MYVGPCPESPLCQWFKAKKMNPSEVVNQLVVYRILGQSQTRDGATNCVGAFHVLFDKEHHQ